MASIGLLAFWAGLYLASRRFPSEYDWRYMTISSLLYPDRDPRGYAWAWCGVVACALGGLCWVSELMRSNANRSGTLALAFGYLCMVGCAVWPGHLLHLPRGHDLLALLAFVGICAGTVCLTYERVERGLRRRRVAARARLRECVRVQPRECVRGSPPPQRCCHCAWKPPRRPMWRARFRTCRGWDSNGAQEACRFA